VECAACGVAEQVAQALMQIAFATSDGYQIIVSHPIVIAYHVVWTIYGYWLPNDIRGSQSKTIRKDLLKDLGELHRGRKRVQPTRSELLAFFSNAKDRLAFEVCEFRPREIACIAEAFARTIESCKYTCYACAIMPDHIHLIIRKHKHTVEEMIANLQRESHIALRDAGLFPMDHPIWGGPGWSVFLDDPDDVWRTIRYIENNPLEIGLPKQVYPFVKAYDNWPLHEGHSPNSPYAKGLRRTKGC
jgi:REP element-mobilizing transposase RayT